MTMPMTDSTMRNPIQDMVEGAVKEAIREVVREELAEQLKEVVELAHMVRALMVGFAQSKGMVANAFREAMRNGTGD